MTLLRTYSLTHFVFVPLLALSSMTACQKYTVGGNGGGSTDPTTLDDKDQSSSNSLLRWSSGLFYKSGETSTNENTLKSEFEDRSAFCFDNSDITCVNASSAIRADVGNSPVPIMGFQLMITKKVGDQFTIKNAWFVTAEPRVDTVNGNFLYYDKQIRTWNGSKWERAFSTSGCDPNDGSAVGFLPDSNSQHKILTGLHAFSDASLGGAGADASGNIVGYSRSNGHLHAGKVWYSAFVPRTGDTDNPYQFEILPKLPAGDTSYNDTNFADTSNFGLNADSAENPSASNNYALPRVGLTSADDGLLNETKWYSHVIVGFCIDGTRVEPIDGTGKSVTHSLLFGLNALTYKPVMMPKSAAKTK